MAARREVRSAAEQDGQLAQPGEWQKKGKIGEGDSAETKASQFTKAANAVQILLMSDEKQFPEVRQSFAPVRVPAYPATTR